MRRRLLPALLATTLAVGTAATIATPATAVKPPVAFTAEDLATWQTDGIVWDIATVDGKVFVGGDFTGIRPPGAADGVNELARGNFAVFDAATGNPLTCAPTFTVADSVEDATVRSLNVSPDGNTLYVGGFFSRVSGATNQHLAAIDVDSCTRVTGFTPAPNTTVHTIASTATTVYFGGSFSSADGNTRNRAAAAVAVGQPNQGSVLPWAPAYDLDVLAMALDPANSVVVTGGRFNTMNGASSHALGVVDASTGANVRTYASGFIHNNSVVKAITTDATGFYTGNEGSGGGVFDGRIALDWGTYNQRWRDTCLGATQDVVVYNTVLYSASHAHDCASIGEFPDGERQHFLAQSVNNPAKLGWFPDTNEGIGETIGPRAMAVAATSGQDYLWSGGEFTRVNGVLQQGLTRFGQGPGSASPTVPQTSVASVRPGEVQVAWRTSLDLDDIDLTYSVYREGTADPIYTTQASSVFWSRPQLTFVDTGLFLGASHRYRVAATDPDQTVLSPWRQVTVSSTVSSYADRVDADGANLLWRYDEASGTFFSDYTGSGNSGTLLGTATYQVAPGAVANDPSRAVGLDGASTLYTSSLAPSPSAYSVETWFRTTSNTGGKLIGFGNRQTTNSSNYDKHIYMRNDGRLVFGAYTGSTVTLQSGSSYNDGQWHHVVGTQGSAGMALYVDGVRVGNNGTTTNQNYTGYWRVGGDNLSGWPNRPTSNFFTGDLDETAVYPSALSSSTVAEHYVLGGGTVAPSGPSDFYGSSVYSDGPSQYWRLNEGSGSTANDASGSSVTGRYFSGITYGQSGAVSGTSDDSVRLSGSSSGLVSSTNSTGSPAAFTAETWFRTNTSSGGKIFGFGSSQSGNSSSYDKHVYMRNDGRLVFGVYNGTTSTVTSPNAYNDNQWHHVAASQGPSGTALYVDGVLVDSSAVTQNQNFTGYWRLGGDRLTSWPNPPSSNYLNGWVDEFAVYQKALPASRIAAHYSAGNSSAPDAAPPIAPNGLVVGLTGGSPELAWQAATDNVGVTGYQVHRSSTLGFTPNASTLVATTGGLSYLDTSAPAGTQYYRVLAVDAAGNASLPSMQYGVYVPDTDAPSAPTALSVETTSTSASLSWNPATDNIGVIQYAVHRSSTPGFTPTPANLVKTTTGTDTVDSPVAVGTWYYRVTATDAAGNVGTASAEVEAVVADNTAPTAPSGVATGVAGSTVQVSWTASTDDTGAPTYRVHRSATSGFTPSAATLVGSPSATTFDDTSVPSGIWYYVVLAVDGSGNTSPASPEVQTVVAPSPSVVNLTPTADTYANQGAATTNYGNSSSLASVSSPGATSHLRFVLPTAPAGTELTSATLRLRTTTTATAGSVGDQTVRIGSDAWNESTLTWNNRPPVTGAVLGAIGAGSVANAVYTAPLDVAALTSVLGSQTTIGVTNPGTDSFWFWSRNHANTTYRPQLSLTFSPPDTSAPLSPTGLSHGLNGYDADLTWNVPLDNVGVTGYDLHRSTVAGFTPSPATLVDSSTAAAYSDGDLAPGTYYYRVVAKDAAGNVSNPSAQHTVVVADITGPSAPTGLSAEATPTSATLTWNAASDNVAVTEYDVHRSQTAGFTPSPANLESTVNDTQVEDSPLDFGTYYYVVVAKDAAGNSGTPSAQAVAVVADTTAPTVPTEVSTSVAGSDVTVTWDPSGDDVAIDYYRVHRSMTSGFTPSPATLVDTAGGASFVDAGVPAGTWYYRVVAVDTAGNASDPSDQAQAVVADAAPPTTPTDVGAVVTGPTVDLQWTASTDDGVVTGYEVHRSATSGFTPSGSTLVGTPTGTSFTDSPVGLGTWYYVVIAKDGANNVSGPSTEVTAVVIDVEAPSVPTGVATEVTGDDVEVTWNASTDDTAVTGYDVHRSSTSGFTPSGATLLGTVAGTSFDDTNVASGTWYYRVVAKDAQNNRSDASAQAVADLGDVTAPTRPSDLFAVPSGATVELDWTASTDNVGVTGYEVHRSASSGFTPTGATLVTTAPAASYDESSVSVGTWYYRVIAKDAAGNASTASATAVVVVAPGSPTVVDLTPTADTYANQGAASMNFGSTTSLASVSGTASNSYLRFAIPSAPEGTTLTGATLRVRTKTDSFAGSVGAQTVRIGSDGWTESTLTWNNRPAIDGAVLGSIGAASAPNTVYTSALDASALSGSAGSSVTLAVTNPGSDSFWFWSSNHANASYRPQLTLTYSADVVAPTVPTGLTADVTGSDVDLSWSASTDGMLVAGYEVHRGATAGFVPSAGTRVAAVNGTSLLDASVPAGTWYYKVVARDGAGNRSAASSAVEAIVS